MKYVDALRVVFGGFVLICAIGIAAALRDIADAQIALASDGCYEVPESIHARR